MGTVKVIAAVIHPDAIPVADTYHELTARTTVLEHVFRALRPGGRLVVVDPAPGAGSEDGPETANHRYERPASAETELSEWDSPSWIVMTASSIRAATAGG